MHRRKGEADDREGPARRPDAAAASSTSSTHPIVVTDLTGTIQLWNTVSEERIGWTEAEVLGTSIGELLGTVEEAQQRREVLDPLLEGAARSARASDCAPPTTAAPSTSSPSTRALTSADGEVELIVGVSDDLAELEALEGEAEALHEHLRLALDAGGLGTWRWDAETGVTDCGSGDGAALRSRTGDVHGDVRGLEGARAPRRPGGHAPDAQRRQWPARGSTGSSTGP